MWILLVSTQVAGLVGVVVMVLGSGLIFQIGVLIFELGLIGSRLLQNDARRFGLRLVGLFIRQRSWGHGAKVQWRELIGILKRNILSLNRLLAAMDSGS
jgi:hypothetical protein